MTEQVKQPIIEETAEIPQQGRVRRAASAVSALLRGRGLFSSEEVTRAQEDIEEPYELDESRELPNDELPLVNPPKRYSQESPGLGLFSKEEIDAARSNEEIPNSTSYEHTEEKSFFDVQPPEDKDPYA